MHAFVRRALETALVAGGLMAVGATMAHAADGDPVSGATSTVDQTLATASGLLGTTDPSVAAPVTAPVNVSGASVAVLGDASSSSAPATAGSATDQGTLADAPVSAPVTVSGLSVGVLGDASSAPGDTAAPTAGSGTGSGAVAQAPVTAPVTVSGASVAVLGDAGSSGGTPAATTGGSAAGPGTVADAPVTAPVRLSGTSLALLGDATAAPAAAPSAPTGTSGIGALALLPVAAPVTAPVTVAGTSVALLGDAGPTAPGGTGSGTGTTGSGGGTTTGAGGSATDAGTDGTGTGDGLTVTAEPVAGGLGTGVLAAGDPGALPAALASTGGVELAWALVLAGILLAAGLGLCLPRTEVRHHARVASATPMIPTQRGVDRR